MTGTARADATPPEVAAVLNDRLRTIAGRLGKGSGDNAAWGRYIAALLGDDERLARELGKRTAAADPAGYADRR